jgi:hypothetical protein
MIGRLFGSARFFSVAGLLLSPKDSWGYPAVGDIFWLLSALLLALRASTLACDHGAEFLEYFRHFFVCRSEVLVSLVLILFE